jgi:hypothetical protein
VVIWRTPSDAIIAAGIACREAPACDIGRDCYQDGQIGQEALAADLVQRAKFGVF